jgi:two-component system phosphate regulon response regulator PhoB/two-component system alkaline phosphatase synthesis response regulator PhoP
MKTVLIVDDHADTNEIICKILSREGYRCVKAVTGEAALAVLSVEHPDLVILDSMMPGMDGIEVLRLIRTSLFHPTIPVIFHSAVCDPGFQQHAIDKGANEYLLKGSYKVDDVVSHVAKYLKPPAKKIISN